MDPRRIHNFRLMAAAGEGNDGGGGSADRGDTFVPTGDEEGKDTPEGGAGKDTPEGGDAGKDTPEGGAGKDTPEGGGGDDTPEGEEGEDGKEGKKKPGGIPWSRHKDLLKKEREARERAETELAKFKSGDRITAMNEDIAKGEQKIEQLDAEYTQLVTDGKHQEASKKMAEIRKLERELSETKANFKATVAETRAVERARYENTVEKLESAYPVLNPDDAEYDEDKAQDVLDLAAVYNQRGDTPSKALQKAAEKLLGTATKAQESAVKTDTKVSEDDKAKALAEERRKAQVKKNLDAKGKQPPSKEAVGADHDKAGGSPIDGKSVMQMGYDDFVKLDEQTLSRLRGDMVGA